jgi:hypothetical protein
MNFFFWGYIKEKVNIPLLAAHLQECKNRIHHALASTEEDILHKAGDEFKYHLDMSRLPIQLTSDTFKLQ